MAIRIVGGPVIRYFCVGHRTAAVDRSPVTVHGESWAYCLSGCAPGHEWAAIEPMSHEELRHFGPRFIDRAVEPSRPRPVPLGAAVVRAAT